MILKRGYLILISGGILLVAGILISAMWAGSFAGQFLQENTIIGQTVIEPSNSVDVTLHVDDISRPLSLILFSESIEPDSENPILRETVLDPRDRVVDTNVFSKEFTTTFKVNSVGEFTLTISNQGARSVNVDGIFGYIPIVDENGQVDLSVMNGLLIGSILFIIGIITMIVGIVFVIIDRRRENRRPPRFTR